MNMMMMMMTIMMMTMNLTVFYLLAHDTLEEAFQRSGHDEGGLSEELPQRCSGFGQHINLHTHTTAWKIFYLAESFHILL
jgi:hypothetical protein